MKKTKLYTLLISPALVLVNLPSIAFVTTSCGKKEPTPPTPTPTPTITISIDETKKTQIVELYEVGTISKKTIVYSGFNITGDLNVNKLFVNVSNINGFNGNILSEIINIDGNSFDISITFISSGFITHGLTTFDLTFASMDPK